MKVLKYNIIGLIFALLSLASCETLETTKQDVEPVVSPDGYPVATFTSSEADNTISEGDTLIYTITINKMIDRAINFNAELVGGTLTEDDYVVVPGTLQPFTTETQLLIILPDDGIPNGDKTGQFQFDVPGIAEHYLLNPSQQYPLADITVKNMNDPTALTIIMEWEGESDFDFVIWQDGPLTEFGDGGATTANPESDQIANDDPDGTYYIDIMDWDGGPFDYTFTIGMPDGAVQTISGTFDKGTKTYLVDPWTAWGGSYDSYRVLKVEKTGSTYVVTELVD